jgi:hypothetical protein
VVGIEYVSKLIGYLPSTIGERKVSKNDSCGRVGVGDGVGVGVVVGVGAGVGSGVGVGVGVGSTGLNTGFGTGLGATFTVTPLFQTSFIPDLMQVNFFPLAVAVVPALLHLAPALGVAA